MSLPALDPKIEEQFKTERVASVYGGKAPVVGRCNRSWRRLRGRKDWYHTYFARVAPAFHTLASHANCEPKIIRPGYLWPYQLWKLSSAMGRVLCTSILVAYKLSMQGETTDKRAPQAIALAYHRRLWIRCVMSSMQKSNRLLQVTTNN